MASCQTADGVALGVGEAAPLAADVTTSLARVKAFIEPLLDTALSGSADMAPRLLEAMRYALLAPVNGSGLPSPCGPPHPVAATGKQLLQPPSQWR